MSENRTRNYEMKCLLQLLSAIVNEEQTPKWKRKPNWGEIYKLADYHEVANVVYYGVIGSEIPELVPWKKKFEERFHTAVQNEERYSSILPEVLTGLEERKISCLALKDYQMSRYYPHADMRMLRKIEIYVEKGSMDEVRRFMLWMDFEERDVRDDDGVLFYKIPGMSVMFREDLSFTNKKTRKYFAIPLKSYPRREGYKYIRVQDQEERYLFVISCAAESYALGKLDVQDVLDIWYYYLQVYLEMDWSYINKEFEKIDIIQFSECIIKLAAFWFGGMLFPADNELFSAMEKYILTKGIQGRTESSDLLPLVKEVADFYKKDLKRERRQRMLLWLFPGLDYMDTLFPALQKWRFLLPLFWALRLIHCGMRILVSNWIILKKQIKNRWSTVRSVQSVRWGNFWGPKQEKLARGREKRRERIGDLAEILHGWLRNKH